MQAFTKIEIGWMVDTFKQAALVKREAIKEGSLPEMERSILELRAEQFESIASRLASALEHENKRIEIKY